MSWLLDTCVLSEYAKKAPAPKVISWLDEQDEESLYISVISLGEIRKGILKLRASDRRRSQQLTAWLGKLEQRFAGRILPLDAATLYAWASQQKIPCLKIHGVIRFERELIDEWLKTFGVTKRLDTLVIGRSEPGESVEALIARAKRAVYTSRRGNQTNSEPK